MGPVDLGLAGPNHRTATFRAMGTVCRYTIETASPATADAFRVKALQWVDHFEATCSRFLANSLISQINQAAGHHAVEVPDEVHGLLMLCDRMYWQTGGVFDPTSLPLTHLWKSAAQKGVPPSTNEVQHVLEYVGWNKVQRSGHLVFLPLKGMELDLGGIGKEYAVDRILEMGREFGFPSMLVDFGQDVRAYGQAPQGGPWRVGLEHPDHPGTCWSGVALNDRAVATSGDYFRYFEINGKRYPHVIDPRSGHPIDNQCRSVSTIAATCTEAGVMAKSIMILGSDDGQQLVRRFPLMDTSIWTTKGIFQTSGFPRHVITTERQ